MASYPRHGGRAEDLCEPTALRGRTRVLVGAALKPGEYTYQTGVF